jgi:predicted transcriptional regulator
MVTEISVFEEDEAEDASRHARALAEIAAGRLIANDEVCAWLETWRRPEERPAPECWFA